MADIKKTNLEAKNIYQNSASMANVFELGSVEPDGGTDCVDKTQFKNMMMKMFGFTPTQAEASFEKLPNKAENISLEQVLNFLSGSDLQAKHFSVSDIRKMFENTLPTQTLPPIVAMADFKSCCGNNTEINQKSFLDLAKRLGINDTNAVKVVFDEVSQGNSGLDATSFIAAFGGDRVAKAQFLSRFNAIKDNAGKENKNKDDKKTPSTKVQSFKPYSAVYNTNLAQLTEQNNEMLVSLRRSFERRSAVPSADLISYKDEINNKIVS
jgi:hypothetical protein